MGGGVQIDNSEVVVKDSLFKKNICDHEVCRGGGASFVNGATVLVESSEFIMNYSRDIAGGLYTDLVKNVEVNGAKFEENRCDSAGNSVYS